MRNHLQRLLQKGVQKLRGLTRTQKKNIILAITILVLGTGLFFYHYLGQKTAISKAGSVQEIDPLVLDPLNRIGKGINKTDKKICDKAENEILRADRIIEEKMLGLLNDHHIEVMVPELAKQDKEVASFVFAIAKKESDWGKHAPHKNGRDCYNYWGYKGGYNPTRDGYSCFDSPKQAVEEVSQRIATLIDKKINTPERMVVWKCGSTCAGHDPGGVQKWISDVRTYKSKLN